MAGGAAPRGAELLAFTGFRDSSTQLLAYGYGPRSLRDMREREFGRLAGTVYLDHAGATMFPQSQLTSFTNDLMENVYGNPHSQNISSKLTHDTVERVRYRILEHFCTSAEDYSVIFTAGSTAALKLVAEAFPWASPGPESSGSRFCYLTDSHTSVVGMRKVTTAMNVTSIPVRPEDMCVAETRGTAAGDPDCQLPHLFCYPAQSNFSGTRYPLSWIGEIKAGRMCPVSVPGKWFVLLDAASYVSTSPLDLSVHQADFVPLSFYKIFGFPTGLGALLVNNRVAPLLRKTYFGGGTAAAYLAGQDFYIPRQSVAERFEDGTISFLDVIALKHGFDALERLTGGMENIQQHTFTLAQYTYTALCALRYPNGAPVVRIYSDSEFSSPEVQGPVINFNVLDHSGNIIGYSQVDKMASLHNIHVRTGCFCNTGACQRHLGISDEMVKKHLQVTKWPIGNQGLLYDRSWMVVNRNGVCLSQKQEPRLCLIQPFIDLQQKIMVIKAKEMEPIEVPLEENGERTQICQSKVCADRVNTYNCGEKISSWLSSFLGHPCQLLKQSSNFQRSAKKRGKDQSSGSTATLSLVNEAQYLLINTSSVLELQQQLKSSDEHGEEELFPTKELISRFRANIITNGTRAFEEETWDEISIGSLRFQVVAPCHRCQMICINQQTGQRNQNVFQKLSESRARKVNFGVYLMHTSLDFSSPSFLSVGSQVLPVLKENTERQDLLASEKHQDVIS
ncbi:molybdenum cofactor sulfurase isoform X3 [Hyaena hyaena]|uniref:molybdenum cofactor sulfurase isoform X3 n=1 Tax=Hyaena hyaena TaxID=95912 RepID=UPI001924A50C|nr:molybdenum cofactor sulfurase isoform X3 [Hyaena hyaena]